MNQPQPILNASIARVATVADHKSPMPALQCLRFANGKIEASNLEQSWSESLDHDLDVLIPARKLATIVRSAPKTADINVEQGNGNVTVKFGRSRYTIPTVPTDQWPEPPRGVSQVEFAIQGYKLAYLFGQVIDSAAKDDVRYFLNGVLLEIADGKITAVGTDGHRMSFVSSDVDCEQEASLIVPRTAVDAIMRDKPEQHEQITVSYAPSGYLELTFEDATFGTRLIDGKFPNWRKVVPDNEYNATFDRTDLLDAAKRASGLFKTAKLSIRGDRIEIIGESAEGERAIDEIDAKCEHDVDIAFHLPYLIDALDNADNGSMTYTSGDKAAVVDGRHVLMPVRL